MAHRHIHIHLHKTTDAEQKRDEGGKFASSAQGKHGWKLKHEDKHAATFTHPEHAGHHIAVTTKGPWIHTGAGGFTEKPIASGGGQGELSSHLKKFHGATGSHDAEQKRDEGGRFAGRGGGNVEVGHKVHTPNGHGTVTHIQHGAFGPVAHVKHGNGATGKYFGREVKSLHPDSLKVSNANKEAKKAANAQRLERKAAREAKAAGKR